MSQVIGKLQGYLQYVITNMLDFFYINDTISLCVLLSLAVLTGSGLSMVFWIAAERPSFIMQVRL